MKEEIISIWSSYTEQANELTNKRLTMSSFFFAISAALLGLSIPYLGLPSLIISTIGLLLSIMWCLMILSFKSLNSAKFEVIAKIEEKMPIKPYEEEWLIAKKKRYIKITTIETIIALVIVLGFISLIVISILKLAGEM